MHEPSVSLCRLFFVIDRLLRRKAANSQLFSLKNTRKSRALGDMNLRVACRINPIVWAYDDKHIFSR